MAATSSLAAIVSCRERMDPCSPRLADESKSSACFLYSISDQGFQLGATTAPESSSSVPTVASAHPPIADALLLLSHHRASVCLPDEQSLLSPLSALLVDARSRHLHFHPSFAPRRCSSPSLPTIKCSTELVVVLRAPLGPRRTPLLGMSQPLSLFAMTPDHRRPPRSTPPSM